MTDDLHPNWRSDCATVTIGGEVREGLTGVAKGGYRFLDLPADQVQETDLGQAVAVEANGERFAVTVETLGAPYRGGKRRRLYFDADPV